MLRFAYRLARQSGVKEWILDVNCLLREMSWSRFVEWFAYESLEPWEGSGVVASLLANIHRDPKKRCTPFEPGDFFVVDSSIGTKRPLTRSSWVGFKEAMKSAGKPQR